MHKAQKIHLKTLANDYNVIMCLIMMISLWLDTQHDDDITTLEAVVITIYWCGIDHYVTPSS